MDKKDELDFDLEDILQEFSEHSENHAEPEPEPAEALGDTIRLDKVRKAVQASQPELTDTVPFKPVGGAVPIVEPEPEVPQSPQPEPFSEDWEPEYDEPMGEYPIPEPIVFRPKSRLKELRSKLVAGPEKMYYSLSRQGLGKLQLSMLLCFGIFLFCAGFTALYAWGYVAPERLRLVVFIQFLGMLLSALLGCNRLMEGLGDLLRLRFSVNTLLVCTLAVCCIDGVVCLQQTRIPISAAFCLEMTIAMWSAYNRRSTLIGETDTLRRATTLDSVAVAEDYHQGKAGFLTGRGEVEHYMDNYAEPSKPEKVLDIYALVVLALSLTVGIVGGVRHGLSEGIQVCAGAMLMGLPATAFLVNARPKAILEKRLHKLGTVLCGWKGIKAACGSKEYPLTDNDLFPAGAVKLNGVKFYGDRNPDEVVEFATALITANGGTLMELFNRLLESRNGYRYQVENLNCYGNGGIGGEIEGEAVLIGTLQFMREMGVFMDEGTQIDRAVYCAIDGELCGVFAVTYGKSKSSANGVRTLCGSKNLTPVAICEDFMLTGEFIRSRFNVNTQRMAFPERKVRQELGSRELTGEEPVVALTTREGLAPRAFAVTGARTLRSAMRTGVAIHMAGGILGLLMVAALAWVGGGGILTPANILLYELIWMIPGLLVTEWTRTI